MLLDLVVSSPRHPFDLIITQDRAGYRDLSEALIASVIRFSAENDLDVRPAGLRGREENAPRFQFHIIEPGASQTTNVSYERVGRETKMIVGYSGRPSFDPSLPSGADCLVVADSLDGALAPLRVFLPASGAIGFDLADVWRVMDGGVCESKLLPVWQLKALHGELEACGGAVIGFSNRLSLQEVDELCPVFNGECVLHMSLADTPTTHAELIIRQR